MHLIGNSKKNDRPTEALNHCLVKEVTNSFISGKFILQTTSKLTYDRFFKVALNDLNIQIQVSVPSFSAASCFMALASRTVRRLRDGKYPLWHSKKSMYRNPQKDRKVTNHLFNGQKK